MGETADLKAEIERDLDAMIADKLINPEQRDTAKLLLTAIVFGCKNIDELAFRSGLPRDRFVRPIARRMRASHVWNRDGSVSFEYPDDAENTNTEFVLHVLCAEGLIVNRGFSEPGSPEGNVVGEVGAVDQVEPGASGI